jgi:tRNA (cmo5U34)-methyltransferase
MSDIFNFNTIEHFDSHISNSIKGYELLDELIVSISSFWAKDGEFIIDYGCTSGRLINRIQKKYPKCSCIGYDITDHNFIKQSLAKLIKTDISKNSFSAPKCNLALSIFTLQFLSHKDRLALINKVYQSLNTNGAFVICEKEICSNGLIQEVFTFSNYDYKRLSFSAEQILNKERDLRAIMNPLVFGENEKILTELGFKVYPFFQSLNFRGWIALK